MVLIRKRKIVGVLQSKINRLLSINLPITEIYVFPGLRKHILLKHKNCLKYLGDINIIIQEPDYIGVNPNEQNSVEYVKTLDNNVLVSVNLSSDSDENYLFVSSVYDISNAKLQNRLHSKRLVKFTWLKNV